MTQLIQVTLTFSGCPLIFHYFAGGKGVKKAITKVASGLVRDEQKIWFSELSDKGEVVIIINIKVGIDRKL